MTYFPQSTQLSPLRRLRSYGFLIIGLSILVGLFFIDVTRPQRTPVSQQTVTTTIVGTSIAPPAPPKRYFDNLGLGAHAAYVYDVRTAQSLYTYNAKAVLPLASITKIMTILTARDYFRPTDTITMTTSALSYDGEYGFLPYDTLSFADLSDIILLASSNDAAEAVREAFDERFGGTAGTPASFIHAMNEKAQAIGLSETSFSSASGLDLEGETVPGALGTAHDVAHLFAYVLTHDPELLAVTRAPRVSHTSELYRFLYTFDNTNELIDEIPWFIGGKTGFTDLAGGNLAIVFDVGLAHPVVGVVLGSTKEGRFIDMEKLIDATFKKVRGE